MELSDRVKKKENVKEVKTWKDFMKQWRQRSDGWVRIKGTPDLSRGSERTLK